MSHFALVLGNEVHVEIRVMMGKDALMFFREESDYFRIFISKGIADLSFMGFRWGRHFGSQGQVLNMDDSM